MLADINKMENYEKKYKSLVEAVKTLKEANPSDEGIQNWIKDNVPELKESEDEKIRKKLISLVENWKIYNPKSPFDDYPVYTSDKNTVDKILAWLEKQGEHKSADKVEPKFKVGNYIERKDGLGCHAKIIFVGENVYGCEKLIYSEDSSPFFELMFKNQDEFQISSDFEQSPVWSEKDLLILDSIISVVEEWEDNRSEKEKEYYGKSPKSDWLKSLKDKYTWKPSKEQIIALRWVLNNVPYCKHKEEISGLLDQLKKLKEV